MALTLDGVVAFISSRGACLSADSRDSAASRLSKKFFFGNSGASRVSTALLPEEKKQISQCLSLFMKSENRPLRLSSFLGEEWIELPRGSIELGALSLLNCDSRGLVVRPSSPEASRLLFTVLRCLRRQHGVCASSLRKRISAPESRQVVVGEAHVAAVSV